MGPSESESPRCQPATSSERAGRCRRISSTPGPPSPSAPLVLHWVTSLKAAKEPTGALCARERITLISTGPDAHTASVRATSPLIAPTLLSAPCVVVDTVPMMPRASRGESMPRPRTPGRPHLCRGALTLVGEVFPSKLLVPSPLVLPGLPHAREGGPLQGSPSPSPPALERLTLRSHPTPASLTSLFLWTCQRPVTNESP